jgi:bacterioferritin-associated ferredoxin
MYVCLCKGITDSQIRTAVGNGMTNYRELRLALGLSSQCGKCAVHAREVFREAILPESHSSLYYAASRVA